MAACAHCGNKESHGLCIHKVPIFSPLDHKDLLKIASLIQHKTYRKGEFIIRQKDTPKSLIILNEGSAKAITITPDGREQILHIYTNGDFFGEQFLISDQEATFSVQTLQNTAVCMIEKRDFEQVLRAFPDIALKVISELGTRMSRLETSLQSMGVRNVDARVAALLLDWTTKYATQTPEGTVIRLPLSREGIANYLGITRETVSRKLGQLENEMMIRTLTNKTILILNLPQLEMLAGES